MKRTIFLSIALFSLSSAIYAGKTKTEYDTNGRMAVNQHNCDLALHLLVSNTLRIEEFRKSSIWTSSEEKQAEKEIDAIRPFLKLCVEKEFIN
ncbi:MAG: hypothetical protein Q8L85_09275 [Alphaproteobacteria bacterium]|nr:hypothetical protein [Alphaproteobacteria bacterium]